MNRCINIKICRHINGSISHIIFDERYEIRDSDGIVYDSRFNSVKCKEYPDYINDDNIQDLIKAIWKN